MSLRGIEGQMIINRTSDYARDVSSQMRRDAVSQDYLAYQNKVTTERQAEQVAQMQAKEDPRVRAEEENEGGKQNPSEPRKRKKKQPGTVAAPEGIVFTDDNPSIGIVEPNFLDIEI